MSESIVLDTKPQIHAWVIISRRHQVAMHLKGYKVKGILSALRRDFGDHGNRVANYVVPIEFAASEAGIDVDYSKVNVHVMLSRGGMFFDRGIFANMDEAGTPELRDLFAKGLLEVVLTTDDVREPNGGIFVAE